MSRSDALQSPLDAQSNQINNLGDPSLPTDATHVTVDPTQIKDLSSQLPQITSTPLHRISTSSSFVKLSGGC